MFEFYEAAMDPYRTPIQLSLGVRDTPIKDILSSDPMCVLYEYEYRCAKYVKIGRTEYHGSTKNIDFNTSFSLSYGFQSRQKYRVQLYDVDDVDLDDLSKHDYIGYVDFTLADVMTSRGSMLSIRMTKPDGVTIRSKCRIIVRADNMEIGRQIMYGRIRALKLERYGLLSDDNTVLEICGVRKDQTTFTIHRSEIAPKGQSPQFESFRLNYAQLTKFDLESALIRVMKVKPDDPMYDPRLIGEAVINVNMYRTDTRLGDLTRRKNIELFGKNKTKHMGTLVVDNLTIEEEDQFVDYLQAGMKFNTIVGIDFTASNNLNDLHGLENTTKLNEYVLALKSMGSILAHYVTPNNIYAYGFGANVSVDGYTRTSHCFPLSLNLNAPHTVKDFDELIDLYVKCKDIVQFSGPTKFSELVDRTTDIANLKKNDQNRYKNPLPQGEHIDDKGELFRTSFSFLPRYSMSTHLTPSLSGLNIAPSPSPSHGGPPAPIPPKMPTNSIHSPSYSYSQSQSQSLSKSMSTSTSTHPNPQSQSQFQQSLQNIASQPIVGVEGGGEGEGGVEGNSVDNTNDDIERNNSCASNSSNVSDVFDMNALPNPSLPTPFDAELAEYTKDHHTEDHHTDPQADNLDDSACFDDDSSAVENSVYAPSHSHSNSRENGEDDSQYEVPDFTLLFLLTDGIVDDFEETVASLVKASTCPVGIVIFGVGETDFTKMNDLDSDSAMLVDKQGNVALRDIVQFVPLHKYISVEDASGMIIAGVGYDGKKKLVIANDRDYMHFTPGADFVDTRDKKQKAKDAKIKAKEDKEREKEREKARARERQRGKDRGEGNADADELEYAVLMERLADETLREVPEQVLSYMNLKNIRAADLMKRKEKKILDEQKITNLNPLNNPNIDGDGTFGKKSAKTPRPMDEDDSTPSLSTSTPYTPSPALTRPTNAPLPTAALNRPAGRGSVMYGGRGSIAYGGPVNLHSMNAINALAQPDVSPMLATASTNSTTSYISQSGVRYTLNADGKPIYPSDTPSNPPVVEEMDENMLPVYYDNYSDIGRVRGQRSSEYEKDRAAISSFAEAQRNITMNMGVNKDFKIDDDGRNLDYYKGWDIED